MLEFVCYEYYFQEIVAIVLGKMAVASDCISEESTRYPVCNCPRVVTISPRTAEHGRHIYS